MKTVTVELGGTAYELPKTIQPLGKDNLYVVPFELIRPADKEDQSREDYGWVNPRHYEDGDEIAPQGLTDEEMAELLTEIRDDGLIYPLVCRWINVEDDIYVEILDGERRWRCIDSLVAENEICMDGTGKLRPAQEVYEGILCKVYTANDKEGFQKAYQATNSQVKWGEKANVRAIKHLRRTGATDEEILKLTKKSGQWLREEDKLCNLDDHTFRYYSSSKVNRAVALRMAEIPDLAERHKWVEATYQDAQKADEKRLTKLDGEIARLEDKEEIAEARLAEAEQIGDEDRINNAQGELAEAQEATQSKRRQKARGAQAKTKNLRQVVNQQNGDAQSEEPSTPSTPPPDSVVQPLRAGKIKKQLETLEALEENGGLNQDGEEIVPQAALGYVIAGYKAILHGEENIEKVMKRQTKIETLKEERTRPALAT